ncbi:diguanylate cyclase [Enterovibrio norvegicus FF-33]|uniref:Diguanylate cyclase n=1 Tax=Enterovibrio norvegicus FF-454 TaxID=1185651 RepID=A0A1E5CBT0_9GAMM|nr:GGDEF domain-containing protein [Enterovibrio norvegicus]OEE62949.1 diguanylate cyclase [Enterovibrio norvegicus FF-454]OEE66873.1 diguanylate cyclase [Enterovibrio norvegicus FF-33]
MESAELERQIEKIGTNDTLESWCKCVFEQLRKQNGIKNIALFVWGNDVLRLAASQTQHVFSFYANFKPVEEYSGYFIDWPLLAKKYHDEFSFVSELPFHGGWQKNHVMWEHAVIPLTKSDCLLGFVLVEIDIPNEIRTLRREAFNWLRQDAAFQLKCKVLKHQLTQMQLSKKQNELNLALNNRTLSSQLTYLKSLHEISLRFTKATTTHSLCRIAIELGRDRLQIDRMGIFLCDMETLKMWGTWGTDPHGNVVDRSDFCQEMPNSLFIEEAFTRKNELIVKENVPLYFGLEEVGIGWNIMMAMWDRDECIGWLAADNLIYRSVLDEPKKEAIKLLAASVCQKIIKLRETESANARFSELQIVHKDQAKELAQLRRELSGTKQQGLWANITDFRTGLPNEKHLALSLSGFVSQVRKQKASLAVISIAIDFFRAYEKKYGVDSTDRMLRLITASIEDNLVELESSHLVTTSPGEFVVLVQYDDEVEIRELAEKIVNSVCHLNISSKTSTIYQRITLSAGVHLCGVSLFTKQSTLLKKAEKQRMMAKKLGRNRVCVD